MKSKNFFDLIKFGSPLIPKQVHRQQRGLPLWAAAKGKMAGGGACCFWARICILELKSSKSLNKNLHTFFYTANEWNLRYPRALRSSVQQNNLCYSWVPRLVWQRNALATAFHSYGCTNCVLRFLLALILMIFFKFLDN